MWRGRHGETWPDNNNNNNNEIGADGAIVAEEIVDVGANEGPNVELPLWDDDNNNNNNNNEIGADDVIVVEEIIDVEAYEGPNVGLPVNEIVGHEIVSEEIVDDGMPKERVKRTNIPESI
ncbi:hypothetical protein Tco_0668256 [Tanacetum coccineum]